MRRCVCVRFLGGGAGELWGLDPESERGEVPPHLRGMAVRSDSAVTATREFGPHGTSQGMLAPPRRVSTRPRSDSVETV